MRKCVAYSSAVRARVAFAACLVFSLAFVPHDAVAQTWARDMFETNSHDFGALGVGPRLNSNSFSEISTWTMSVSLAQSSSHARQ